MEIFVGPMHAIVGANNAGKSTILKALEFLFNPTTRLLSDEAFWNGDTAQEIRVEAIFNQLDASEQEQLKSYLLPDGSFKMARIAKKSTLEGSDSDEPESAFKISQQYCSLQPKAEWLQADKISANSIAEWIKKPDTLVINGQDFLASMGSSRKVGDWQTKATEFRTAHLQDADWKETWTDNPKGYAGVLKAALPFFVLVPAVRDVAEEAKVLKTNPFGRLLSAVVGAIASEKRKELESAIEKVTKQLNRIGGEQRLTQINGVEKSLNDAIGRIFANCDLEIEFQTPNFEALMASPRLFVNDGFRGQIEFKGHGLQRAVIFAILRNYADHITGTGTKKGRTLILGVEEPELYMHPLAQRAIRKLFKEIASAGDQVFFTTHSALQVDVADFDEVVRIEAQTIKTADETDAVCTSCRQLPAENLVEDEIARFPSLRGKVSAASLREHYSHAYNRSRNEGFFAQKVILVEGATEEYSLPIYALAMGHDFDLLGISVIEAGGKGPMDRLYRVFNELGIPVFMLLDYDEGNTESNIIEKSKELLRLAGAPTTPPSGLFVNSRVACFQKNWETSLSEEVSDVSTLEGEATKMLGPGAGKPLRARFIARKLTSRTPAVIPSRIRSIIEHAINSQWHASCLNLSAVKSK